ncbi:MAG: hypothetical protein ACKVOK_15035 [Flavobacteriales bacterium]
MFEKKTDKLLSRRKFISRQVRFSLYAASILSASLIIGVAGYWAFAGLGFVDALLNASMILTGMGPVNPMTDNPAKIFASFYAIYSGVAFLSVIGVLSPRSCIDSCIKSILKTENTSFELQFVRILGINQTTILQFLGYPCI